MLPVNSDIWGIFAQCLSKPFLKEFTVLLLTTSLGRQFQVVVILIIIIIIKKDWQCKAGKGRLPLYQSEDPSPTLPTYRGKEEKGKIVEDKKVESN